jgi:hypothetical protein
MPTSSSLRGYRIIPGSLLLAGFAGWLALGCGQGEGDRCEIDSDCNEGKCEVINGNGICRLNPTQVVPTPDAGGGTPTFDGATVVPDAGAPDVVPDAGKVDVVTGPDAPVVDATVDAIDSGHGG